MNNKAVAAFKIASDYLESKGISHDSLSLEKRIAKWDNKNSNFSPKQLASFALANPPEEMAYSDSSIREIVDIIFHSVNYLNS